MGGAPGKRVAVTAEAWIDYILARPPDDGRVHGDAFELIRNDARDVPYSDHHGLVVTIEIGVPTPPVPVLALLLGSRVTLTRRRCCHALLFGVAELISRLRRYLTLVP